jgi:hypothetical protein
VSLLEPSISFLRRSKSAQFSAVKLESLDEEHDGGIPGGRLNDFPDDAVNPESK